MTLTRSTCASRVSQRMWLRSARRTQAHRVCASITWPRKVTTWSCVSARSSRQAGAKELSAASNDAGGEELGAETIHVTHMCIASRRTLPRTAALHTLRRRGCLVVHFS